MTASPKPPNLRFGSATQIAGLPAAWRPRRTPLTRLLADSAVLSLRRIFRRELRAARLLRRMEVHHLHARPIGIVHIELVLAVEPDLGRLVVAAHQAGSRRQGLCTRREPMPLQSRSGPARRASAASSPPESPCPVPPASCTRSSRARQEPAGSPTPSCRRARPTSTA